MVILVTDGYFLLRAVVLCDLFLEQVSNVLQYLFSQIVGDVFPCPALALQDIYTGVSDPVSYPVGNL